MPEQNDPQTESPTEPDPHDERAAEKREQTPSEAMQDFVVKKGRLELGFMGSALQSIRRGLDWEHGEVERESNAVHAVLYGKMGGEVGEQTKRGDDMGDLYLGDVTIQQPPQNQPQAAPIVPAVNQTNGNDPQKNLWRTAVLVGLSSLFGAGAIPIGSAAFSILDGLNDRPASVLPVDFTDTRNAILFDNDPDPDFLETGRVISDIRAEIRAE